MSVEVNRKQFYRETFCAKAERGHNGHAAPTLGGGGKKFFREKYMFHPSCTSFNALQEVIISTSK